MSIKRYDFEYEYLGQYEGYNKDDIYVEMTEDENGEYVKYEDYERLLKRLMTIKHHASTGYYSERDIIKSINGYLANCG